MDTYDVAVVGAGPGGVGAALGAAKLGAKVVLIERDQVLGGMGTAGLVTIFANSHNDGQRMVIGGVFGDLRRKLIERGALFSPPNPFDGEPFDPATYHQIILDECQRLGVQVVFNQTVRSVAFPKAQLVQVPLEQGEEIEARCIVDATGNADIVAAAGVPFTFGRAHDRAVMPLTYCFTAGPIDLARAKREAPDTIVRDTNSGQDFFFIIHQPWVDERIHLAQARGEWSIPRDNGAIYSIPGNRDYVTVNLTRVFVKDPTDPVELKTAEAEGIRQIDECIRFFRKYLPGFEGVSLVEKARQIGVRETRQLCGLYRLTRDDVVGFRQFEDVIAQCCSGIDDHKPGWTSWNMDYFKPGQHYDIPLRCLVPETGPANLIVAGRCVSAERDAMASFRQQSSCMAIGEAAGVTAAISATDGVPVAQVSPRHVQERLLRNGAILE